MKQIRKYTDIERQYDANAIHFTILSKIIVNLLSILKKIESVFISIAAICVLFLMLMTSTDVVFRYFLNRPLGWAYDTTLVLMNGIVFLSLAYVERLKDNVKIEIIIRNLSSKTNRILGIFQSCLGLVAYCLIGYKCALYSVKAFKLGWIYGLETQIPMWVPYSTIAAGSFLLCLRLFFDILSKIVNSELIRNQKA